MTKKKAVIFVFIFLIIIALGGFIYMKSNSFIIDSPISGGKVNNTNPFAPKHIDSKDITKFTMYCYLYDDLDDSQEGTFGFTALKNDDGVLISETRKYVVEETVNISILEEIQSIIDKYELVKNNGIDKYTSGLPPEYQPNEFSVEYASGEKLYFSTNNDPASEWGKQIRDIFKKYFIEKGHNEIKYKDEVYMIDRCHIEFNVDNLAYMYGEIIDNDDNTKLFRQIYDMDKEEMICRDIIDIPEDYYVKLAKQIEKLNLIQFNTGQLAVDLKHTSAGYYEIYIDYKNGRQIYGYSDDISEFLTVREGLLSFFNPLFE